jgi:hypothetical protein
MARTQAQPAQLDRQSRDNPLNVAPDVELPEIRSIGANHHLDLFRSVQAQFTVRHPGGVIVSGPYPSHLEVSINRRGDVTLHPFQLNDHTARLPAEWFEEGDRVSVTRG